jgi:hypothetical protein
MIKSRAFRFIILFLILTICFVLYDFHKFKTQKKDTVDDVFYYGYFPDTVLPETYDSMCKFEINNRLDFPRIKPDKVILHSNNYLTPKRELTQVQVETLLKILNDSSNYRWGELGTPEIHYFFTFLNLKGQCIGITTIDLEGMAYSEPSIARMKWGGLKTMNEVEKLINEIED